jgi:hypothetical protein
MLAVAPLVGHLPQGRAVWSGVWFVCGALDATSTDWWARSTGPTSIPRTRFLCLTRPCTSASAARRHRRRRESPTHRRLLGVCGWRLGHTPVEI